MYLIFIITLVMGVFWHFVVENFWWANLGATISSTFLTCVFALGMHYNINGDTVLVDIAKVFGITFVLSGLIGAVFVNVRKKNAQQRS